MAASFISSFSSVFGSKAEAQSSITVNTMETSQNMALLENRTLSAVILNEKKDSKIDENSLVLTDNNALVPALLSIGGPDNGEKEVFSSGISVYVVRSGDTLSQIAEMFEISQNTILWANDMKKGSTIKEGDILLILPVSGVEHTVKKGETLKSIATKYKIEESDIIWHNNLEENPKLTAGDKLIIPGAELFDDAPANTTKSNVAKNLPQSALKNVSGYYINPLPNSRRSRGITGSHRGVDLAAPTGTPIYASAAGRVSLARGGYNGGFGTMVVIKHPNGTETLYSHMSKLGTSTGAQVTQGQVIGYVGSTGRSTGPHLHFEVKGAKNPF